MGKRRSRRKTVPKINPVRRQLDTVFNCPFCNHEKSCEAIMDRNRNVGRIECRVCKESFQADINHLTEPVDVYSEWIDACERANV
uniref:Transcription elongation factor 1 homolog n=1 Tax=Trichuris muris TaxID=70415 RepID=A0A5S6QV99_TRIMR